MRAAPIALSAAAWLAAASPAAAQDGPVLPATEVTPEGARAIAERVGAWIDRYYAGALPPGMALNLLVDVRPAGRHYLLTLKDVRFDAVGIGNFEFGTITSRLLPLEAGLYDTDTRLPGRMVFRPAGGEEVVLTIAEQDLQGVYDPAIETFASFDMQLDGVALTAAGEAGRLEIGSCLAWGDARETAPGRFEYGSAFEITELEFRAPDSRGAVARMWLDATVADLALPAYLDFYNDYMEIMVPAGGPRGGVLSPAEAGQLADLLDRTGTLVGGIDYEAGVAGVEIDGAEGEFRLEEAVVSFAAGPFGAGNSSLRLGLSIGPMHAEPDAPALPEEIEFEFAALDLPNAPLWDGLIASLRYEATGDVLTAEEAGSDLINALAAAGSRLSLESLSVRAAQGWLDAAGELRTEPGATFGATGEGWLETGGLNGYLRALSDEEGSGPLVAALTVLQTLSQAETGADRAPFRRLEIRLGEDGRVLVNGADIAPLLGAFGHGP